MEDAVKNLKRICKVCLKEDFRVLAGHFGKDKRWMNVQGGYWNGNVCPKCNVIRVRHTMRRVRDARKKPNAVPTE